MMTEPTIVDARELSHLVHGSVLLELGAIGEKVMLDLMPTVDGLLQVIAQLSVETGLLQTPKDERLFADRIRDALKAHVKDARNRPAEKRWAYPVQSSQQVN